MSEEKAPMTIERARELCGELEGEIEKLMKQFEEDTELTITSVEIQRQDFRSFNQPNLKPIHYITLITKL